MKKLLCILAASMALAGCCGEKAAHKPVNPNATREARQLLDFLYEIQGKYTLSGQHNFASGITKYDDEVYSMTGKRPVVWGSDFSFEDVGEGFQRYQHAGPLNISVPFDRPCVETGLSVEDARQGIVDEAIVQARQGRIITLMWHCCDPRFTDGGNTCNGDKVWTLEENAPSEREWDELCTDGTALNTAWKKEMDSVIPYLKQLHSEGIPVLWRPYHEMNGAWFWWGNKPGEDGFKRLWIMTYEYFTAQGLNNLLWVWDANAPRIKPGDDALAYELFYPGNEYVDVLAADVYGWDYKLSHHDELVTLGGGKPIALGEIGQLPREASFFDDQPQWTWFMVWGYFIGSHRNTEDHLKIVQGIYNNPKVLTLDRISYKRGRYTVNE